MKTIKIFLGIILIVSTFSACTQSVEKPPAKADDTLFVQIDAVQNDGSIIPSVVIH